MTCFRLNGKSVHKLLKELGMKRAYKTFFERMEDGFSVDEAVAYAIQSFGSGHKPKWYLGDVPFCKIYKVNGARYNMVLQRVRNGMPMEEAVRRYGVKRCRHCGKPMPASTFQKHYCCHECGVLHRTSEVECSWCGKKFRVINQEARRRRKLGIFCCKECYTKARLYFNRSKKRDFNYKVKPGRKQDIKL